MDSKKKIICHVNLPNAGLGNKLLTWAYGVVFSQINNCELLITRWVSFHIGPLLRREKSLRFYRGYFNQKIGSTYIKLYFNKIIGPTKVIDPSEVNSNLLFPNRYSIYEIQKYPNWEDYFGIIRIYRKTVIDKFFVLLSERVKTRVDKHTDPIIAIHIRRGDFKLACNSNLPFGKQSNPLTPESYFIDLITRIRNFISWQVPVTVFSDGEKGDFKELFMLPNVRMVDNDLDIVHMLLMSQSKILIPSAGSTFSLWAAFISNAIILKHPNHILKPIRDDQTSLEIYEGVLPELQESWPDLLISNLNTMIKKKENKQNLTK